MENNLLPCPFCGSDQISLSTGLTGDDKPWPYIECETCGATTEPDVWNKRTPLPALTAGHQTKSEEA